MQMSEGVNAYGISFSIQKGMGWLSPPGALFFE